MSRNLVPSVAAPRRRRFPAGLAFAGALLVALALTAALALQTAPRTGGAPPPDAATTHAAMAAGQTLRAFVKAGAPDGRLVLSAPQIGALLASGARLAPGVSGVAHLAPDGMGLDLSLGAPWVPAGLWANLSLEVAAPADGLRVTSARLGRLPLPPALVQAAVVRGLDQLLHGNGLVSAGLAGLVGVNVVGEDAVFDFAYGPAERATLKARLTERLARSAEAVKPIRARLVDLHQAGDAGGLGPDGSLLPFLHILLDGAGDPGDGLLAFAIYCGEPAIGSALGLELAETLRGDPSSCDPATLGGRDDLKRHFAVSAGLYAASTAEATVGIGELKELFDTGDGGSGFSFDDLAADLAGARFAAVLLATPAAGWPELHARITAESDILPEIGDLPTRLSAAAFAARFGDVDSADYRALVAEITRRIDALPFHRATAGG